MSQRLWTAVVFMMSFIPAFAQRHEQLWFDYQLDYPFANQYLFEVTTSYQTVLSPENKWSSYSITPTFEYHLLSNLDLIGTIPMVRSKQKEGVNTMELDPALGVRYHISQNKRVNSRLILKAEERFFYHQETNDWSNSNRIRLKGEVWISINGPNLFQDKLWYAILDYEEFFVTDQQLQERFANLRRGRIGLGYRLNYRNRFELIYTMQSSRDEIDGDFASRDNVLQIRYKMFLNPSKVKTENATPVTN